MAWHAGWSLDTSMTREALTWSQNSIELCKIAGGWVPAALSGSRLWQDNNAFKYGSRWTDQACVSEEFKGTWTAGRASNHAIFLRRNLDRMQSLHIFPFAGSEVCDSTSGTISGTDCRDLFNAVEASICWQIPSPVVCIDSKLVSGTLSAYVPCLQWLRSMRKSRACWNSLPGRPIASMCAKIDPQPACGSMFVTSLSSSKGKKWQKGADMFYQILLFANLSSHSGCFFRNVVPLWRSISRAHWGKLAIGGCWGDCHQQPEHRLGVLTSNIWDDYKLCLTILYDMKVRKWRTLVPYLIFEPSCNI